MGLRSTNWATSTPTRYYIILSYQTTPHLIDVLFGSVVVERKYSQAERIITKTKSHHTMLMWLIIAQSSTTINHAIHRIIPNQPSVGFYFFQVPALHDLTEELAHWKGDASLLNYKKTSLRPYIELFDRFLEKLTQESGVRATPSTCKTGTKITEGIHTIVEGN